MNSTCSHLLALQTRLNSATIFHRNVSLLPLFSFAFLLGGSRIKGQ